MFGSTDRVVAWLVTTAHTPVIKSNTRTAATPIAKRRCERLTGATVGGGDGYATATVSASKNSVSNGAGAAAGLVSRRVDLMGAAITMVVVRTFAGGAVSDASSASTNSVAEPHLAAGSLARPFISTPSSSVPRAALRELAAGGRRWTCAYKSSINPSPSKGMTPVSIS